MSRRFGVDVQPFDCDLQSICRAPGKHCAEDSGWTKLLVWIVEPIGSLEPNFFHAVNAPLLVCFHSNRSKTVHVDSPQDWEFFCCVTRVAGPCAILNERIIANALIDR